MNKKEIAVQIFTGGYEEPPVTWKQVKSALEAVIPGLPVKKVIMGWAPDSQLYQKAKQFLNRRGAELYLWLPVFSETGLLKPVHRLIDRQGNEVAGFHLKNGENFEFYCPNQEVNIESVISLFDEYFNTEDFDGVFLDKIRFPSFVSGISGVFNCFCDNCRKKYEEQGIDTELLMHEMEKVEAGEGRYGEVPFGITGYQKGHYTFSAPVWEAFFRMKCSSVTEAVAALTSHFNKKGMKTGLDTFAPFMAEFTGQDIGALMRYTDFIKPMMYRSTSAPAGLPFEYEMFLKETVRKNELEMTRSYMEVLGTKGVRDGKFDRDFSAQELRELSELETPVYAGIEVNRILPIAPVVPSYITENLTGFEQTGIKGYVLSWDLLSAPDENVNEVIQFFAGR